MGHIGAYDVVFTANSDLFAGVLDAEKALLLGTFHAIRGTRIRMAFASNSTGQSNAIERGRSDRGVVYSALEKKLTFNSKFHGRPTERS